jgi:hypothetical protein
MAGGGKQVTNSELRLPEWLNQGAQDTFRGATAAAAANPITQYTGQMAPGSNANLEGASGVARQGQGAGMGDLNAARMLTAGAATGSTPRVSTQDWSGQAAQSYMNPYRDAVQGRTLNEMSRQNQRQIAEVGDSAQGSRAYGGLRHAVLEGETRAGQNRNMMDYLAQSNMQGYDDAYGRFAADRSSRQGAESTNASLTQGDFMRMMQGGGQMAGIGSTAAGLRSSSVDDLLRTGLTEQNTQGGQLDADYQEFLRMQDAPMQRYQQLMGMLSGAPTNRSETSTTRKKNGLLESALGIGSLGVAALSDSRLKRDVRLEGSVGELPLYSYRYAWDKDRSLGFMADDVARIAPEAVSSVFGFNAVDYGKLMGKEAVS